MFAMQLWASKERVIEVLTALMLFKGCNARPNVYVGLSLQSVAHVR
jgi:hypothetical protein